MRHAIYPGTFDPITNGHLDIIERALNVVDKLTVVILINRKKKNLLSIEERVELTKQVVSRYPNVEVASFSGLMVNFCKKINAPLVIRGLRAVSDFEYEYAIYLMNRKLMPSTDTIFLMSSQEHSFISSTIVKEVASYDGDISGQVPPEVEKMLREKFSKN